MFDTDATLQNLPELTQEIIDENLDQQHVAQQHAAQQHVAQQMSQRNDQLEAQQLANFNALREKAEREAEKAMRAEYELAELRRRMQDIESRKQDDTLGLAPDALAEGRHVSSVDNKVRELERKFKEYQQKTSQELMEAQLKAKHPDFDSIVTEDNLQALKRAHPSIARSLATAANSDALSAASSAYSIIKELGIAKGAQESVHNRELIQKNASKPRASQSASPQRGDTPLAQANGFLVDGKASEEYQRQLLKEMYSSMRSR